MVKNFFLKRTLILLLSLLFFLFDGGVSFAGGICGKQEGFSPLIVCSTSVNNNCDPSTPVCIYSGGGSNNCNFSCIATPVCQDEGENCSPQCCTGLICSGGVCVDPGSPPLPVCDCGTSAPCSSGEVCQNAPGICQNQGNVGNLPGLCVLETFDCSGPPNYVCSPNPNGTGSLTDCSACEASPTTTPLFPSALTPGGLISGVAGLLVPIALIISIARAIQGGYYIMMSRGDEAKIIEGKEIFTSAVIGLVLSLTGIAVLNVIFKTFIQ